MARIDSTEFNKKAFGFDTGRPHDFAAADYQVFSAHTLDGKEEIILQINTYGSILRQHEGKMSQNIQIDKALAQKLVKLFQQYRLIEQD